MGYLKQQMPIQQQLSVILNSWADQAAGFIIVPCSFSALVHLLKKKKKREDEAPLIGTKCHSLYRTACNMLSCASFHSLQNSVNY